MGMAALIMTTFFVSEHWLRPVIQHLLDEGTADCLHAAARVEAAAADDDLLRPDHRRDRD